MYDNDYCCRQYPHHPSCPYADEPEAPICPVCGGEADTFYYDKFYDVVGCDRCVNVKDAWEVA